MGKKRTTLAGCPQPDTTVAVAIAIIARNTADSFLICILNFVSTLLYNSAYSKGNYASIRCSYKILTPVIINIEPPKSTECFDKNNPNSLPK